MIKDLYFSLFGLKELSEVLVNNLLSLFLLRNPLRDKIDDLIFIPNTKIKNFLGSGSLPSPGKRFFYKGWRVWGPKMGHHNDQNGKESIGFEAIHAHFMRMISFLIVRHGHCPSYFAPE